MVPSRLTAAERRSEVLTAAVAEFARCGYAGTSTEAIAQRAGISQPYLFRLFGTKKDLFVATLQLVDHRIVRNMTVAAGDLTGMEAMEAMGAAYLELMQDPEMLQVQLHGFAAAAGDEDIARCCRETFALLWQLVHDRTGVSDEEIQRFFAMGMLINVVSAIDLLSVAEPWARSFCPGAPEKTEAILTVSRAVADRRTGAASTEEVPA